MFAYVYTSEDARFETVARAFDMFECGSERDKRGEEEKEEEKEGGGDSEMTNEKRGEYSILSPNSQTDLLYSYL